jgi:hypothetical protein
LKNVAYVMHYKHLIKYLNDVTENVCMHYFCWIISRQLSLYLFEIVSLILDQSICLFHNTTTSGSGNVHRCWCFFSWFFSWFAIIVIDFWIGLIYLVSESQSFGRLDWSQLTSIPPVRVAVGSFNYIWSGLITYILDNCWRPSFCVKILSSDMLSDG